MCVYRFVGRENSRYATKRCACAGFNISPSSPSSGGLRNHKKCLRAPFSQLLLWHPLLAAVYAVNVRVFAALRPAAIQRSTPNTPSLEAIGCQTEFELVIVHLEVNVS